MVTKQIYVYAHIRSLEEHHHTLQERRMFATAPDVLVEQQLESIPETAHKKSRMSQVILAQLVDGIRWHGAFFGK